MLVPLLSGNRVKVSATGCNISIKDANCWFNFDKLPRDYALDMTDGFSRAVAIILLHLIAGHPTYDFYLRRLLYIWKLMYVETMLLLYIRFLFNNIQYDVGKGKKVVPIDLVQDTSTEFTEFFDTRQNSKLKYLMKVLPLTICFLILFTSVPVNLSRRKKPLVICSHVSLLTSIKSNEGKMC